MAMVAPVAASADTATDLDVARRRVEDTENAASLAAGELSDLEGRVTALDQEISRLEKVMDAARERAKTLRRFVRDRAVEAYRSHSTRGLELLEASDDAMDVLRTTKILDDANETDNRAVKQLAAVEVEIVRTKDKLGVQRAEQTQLVERTQAKAASIAEALSVASKARDELMARLAKEQADAAAAAELARLQAVQAASRAVAPLANGEAGGAPSTPGQIVPNPGGGSFQCPLAGSAYSNSYGPRGDGFHYGIDMMAPTGVPEVAVKSGTVSYVPMGGAGGNEAYLAADDGNVYYYAHMSQFVGGPRVVSQGEVIGLVGSTGSSTAPHLHFEIRIGGANGQRINPYPTLQSAGC